MGINIRGRSFLTLLDFTPDEINYLLDLASEFKRMKNNGIEHKWLPGKQIVLLFEKTSTRTRCAFEVGARDLGMGVTFLDSASSQMGKKESLADTAKVLGRMFDGIEYRGFKQSVVEDLARYSGVPVWNGLTSVTVICDCGFYADGLSTACFVLGKEKAEDLLKKYNAEAIFVDEDKNVYVTSGLKDRFELMKDGYTEKDA